MDERVYVRYQGRVQGVGFRATCRSLARGFRVCGYVRNMPDGSVELEAEGIRSEVEDFLSRVRSSHVGAFIREETLQWLPAKGNYSGFEIAL